MSLLTRKPRPIANRDKEPESLRDDRLFIIASDDTWAPKQYFGFFQLTRVQIHVVPTTDGTSVAQHVLSRLVTFEYEEDDERWMVLDTDHLTQGTHLGGFLRAMQDALNQGVKVALSKPCFELWLLLHHVSEADVENLANAHDTEAALRVAIGEYRKTNLKREHYPLASVALAIERAERLDRPIKGELLPTVNTTRVYKLWQAIASKALPTQLPKELTAAVSASSGSSTTDEYSG